MRLRATQPMYCASIYQHTRRLCYLGLLLYYPHGYDPRPSTPAFRSTWYIGSILAGETCHVSRRRQARRKRPTWRLRVTSVLLRQACEHKNTYTGGSCEATLTEDPQAHLPRKQDEHRELGKENESSTYIGHKMCMSSVCSAA